MLLIILLVAVFTTHCTQGQLDEYKQSSGYVEVRKGAHLFYWLLYTTAPVEHYTERPLIIMLYGGPGSSATGYGNILGVGPLNKELQKRNETWIKNFNVMFLDNPVGTGFSYVEDTTLLTKTNSEIASDFMVFIKSFYQSNPEFEEVPLYLYGLGYGAKMAVNIANELKKAEKECTIKSNLRGIFMENSWVSPLDHMYSWPRMVKFSALVEKDGYEKIVDAVKETERLFNAGQLIASRIQRNATISLVINVTTALDYSNIFNGAETNIPDTGTNKPASTQFFPEDDKTLNTLMNSVVKKMLNISETFTWKASSDDLYNAHIPDFMVPVVNNIEKLLNETDIVINVINGCTDLLFNTPGQVAWISKLKWPGAKKFKQSLRQPIWVDDRLEGYYKTFGNLRFNEMNAVGQNVAVHSPYAVNAILHDVKNFNVMFLDNPVGTGFSYVDDPILFTKTNLEIANDFMVFIREFYHRNPEFEVVPLYLYGQAYGSKMAVDMAIKLNQAEKEGTIKSNLRGIIMENPWVSPLDHVYSMLPVLQSAALIEKDGYEKILTAVKETERLYNEGQYAESKIQRNKTSQAVTNATTAIDFNDFFNGALTTIPDTRNAYDNTTEVKTPPNNPPEDKLQLYMNSVVKKLLNIPEKLVWTLYTHGVFVTIDSDFMKPVVNGIENLLTETNLAVTVLNGNLDLICNTAGQVAWISKLKWPGEQEFRKTLRQPIWENDRLEGYYKKHGKFSFYEVNGAGHYVAQYNPDAVRFILRNLTTFG